MVLDTQWALAWLRNCAQVVGASRKELNDLDRAIGDGDHGENLDRGFRAVVEKLDSGDSPNAPGGVFKLAAMTLMSKVGGASGALYGTAFLRAAAAAGEEPELDSAAIVAVLTAARDGIVARGKAESGDKTMIDAWTPAVDAAAAKAGTQDSEDNPVDVLAAAARAAEAGAVATEPLVARKGRASYLGERSVGHRDPGAVSSALLLRSAATTAAEGTAGV